MHAQKLVHTDLKPENVLLLESGYDKEPVGAVRGRSGACLRRAPC